MGAGLQRWWRDPNRFVEEARAWRMQQRVTLAHAIVRGPRSGTDSVRRAVNAFAKLWPLTQGER